ncbi:MAG: SIMPL domain-containing protein [Rickettsiales bacterium]|jgi:uncharacterized protein YggE|nr:SIMPL domain-containing protein [Rickettsiales bacterium]
MKKYYIAGLIGIIVIAVAFYIFGASSRTVSAAGFCVAKVPRDKFSIVLQVRTLDKNAAASLRSVQSAADNIVGFIKNKIDDKTIEIQTTGLYSYEKTEWKKNQSVLLGVESHIDLEVTTSDKKTIDAVLGGIQNVKNARVFPQNMKNFSSRGVIDEATEKCLQEAIADARKKAAAIAAGDGETVGRLLSAAFGAARSDGMNPVLFKAASSRVRDESADYIQSGAGDISVRVDATFGIK